MKGTFLAIVKDHVLKEVGEKNTPAVNVTMETVENVQTKEPHVMTVYWSGWLTEGAFDHTMKSLTDACGWDGEDLSDLNGTGRLVGSEVWVVLEEEVYEGKTRTVVKWLNRLGGGAQKPFDQQKAVELSERLKGKVLAFRQKTPKAPVSDGLKF